MSSDHSLTWLPQRALLRTIPNIGWVLSPLYLLNSAKAYNT